MQPEETRRRSLTRCLSEAIKITEILSSESATDGVCQSGAIKSALTIVGRPPRNVALIDPKRLVPCVRIRVVEMSKLTECVQRLPAVGVARELNTPVLLSDVSLSATLSGRFRAFLTCILLAPPRCPVFLS